MADHLLSLVRGRHGHFKLESGHHGDLWFDLETLCLNSREIRAFAERLAARLKKYQVDVVCGPLVEGAFVALLVSLELGCQFTYAERVDDTTRDGLFPVRYRLPKSLQPVVSGKRVAIVNDVISAGSAVRERFLICAKLVRKLLSLVRCSLWESRLRSLRRSTALPSNFWNACRTIYGSPRNVRSALPESRWE
jgi:orotate phosphoribosyltransferase